MVLLVDVELEVLSVTMVCAETKPALNTNMLLIIIFVIIFPSSWAFRLFYLLVSHDNISQHRNSILPIHLRPVRLPVDLHADVCYISKTLLTQQ